MCVREREGAAVVCLWANQCVIVVQCALILQAIHLSSCCCRARSLCSYCESAKSRFSLNDVENGSSSQGHSLTMVLSAEISAGGYNRHWTGSRYPHMRTRFLFFFFAILALVVQHSDSHLLWLIQIYHCFHSTSNSWAS